MQLDEIGKHGTTNPRKRFWDAVQKIILASEKLVGKNVSVDVREGYGSVINVNPQRSGKESLGACCIDGECSLKTASECSEAGGDFRGPGTTCEGIDCTQGACCLDGECTLTTEEGCAGEFHGYGSTCEGVDCTEPGNTGACCTEGVCTITTRRDCAGVYQGDGTTCEGVDCTKGACCVDGACSQTTEGECTGTFQGLGVPCDPDPCTECTGCEFLNPADGKYYLRKDHYVTGDFHKEFTHSALDAHYDTIRIDQCVGGEVVCIGSGTGTMDYTTDTEFHCHCDETFFCNDPIVAFGFWSESELTFTEVCDEPSCAGAFILDCSSSGAECTFSIIDVYSQPCIPA